MALICTKKTKKKTQRRKKEVTVTQWICVITLHFIGGWVPLAHRCCCCCCWICWMRDPIHGEIFGIVACWPCTRASRARSLRKTKRCTDRLVHDLCTHFSRGPPPPAAGSMCTQELGGKGKGKEASGRFSTNLIPSPVGMVRDWGSGVVLPGRWDDFIYSLCERFR